MNIYFDSSHSTLKYFKNAKVNILNFLIMTGDFNIRDSIWDLSYPHHSSSSDNLMIIADFFNLELLFSTDYVLTRYLDSDIGSNSVIDLMLLRSGSTEINHHSIYPDLQLSSDHAPLSVTIAIKEESIDSFKFSITKNSKEEKSFIKDVLLAIMNINILDLSNSSKIEEATKSLVSRIEHAWKLNAKRV